MDIVIISAFLFFCLFAVLSASFGDENAFVFSLVMMAICCILFFAPNFAHAADFNLPMYSEPWLSIAAVVVGVSVGYGLVRLWAWLRPRMALMIFSLGLVRVVLSSAVVSLRKWAVAKLHNVGDAWAFSKIDFLPNYDACRDSRILLFDSYGIFAVLAYFVFLIGYLSLLIIGALTVAYWVVMP